MKRNTKVVISDKAIKTLLRLSEKKQKKIWKALLS